MTEQQIGDLFQRHKNYLLTVLWDHLYKGCPPDIVYDCLHDVFAIALEKKEEERFNQNPVGWLTLTAKNVAGNYTRKHTNRLRFHLTDFDWDCAAIPDSDFWFEDLAYRMAIENRVWEKILGELKEEDRAIFIMRYYRKLSLDDISSDLGISKNHLNVRISRMKKQIRKLIHKYVGA